MFTLFYDKYVIIFLQKVLKLLKSNNTITLIND